MSCRFGQDDAAYVLGALSPGERLAFERHLPGCEDCTRAVREVAGLPGLLGRIDPDVLTVMQVEPVPDTVLPGLLRAVRRSRRRRLLATAGTAAAAAALVTGGVVSQLPLGGAETPEGTDPPVAVLAMDPVGDAPVVADLALEEVTWGTRLELTCTYDTASVDYELPPEVDYVLVVRTDDGHSERVGSWRSVDGRTMRLSAATAAVRGDISSVEVRTVEGRVVLTLTA